MGSQAAGALLWGLAANGLGLQPAVILAGAVVLAGVVAGIFWRVPEIDDVGAQPTNYWTDARLAFDPEPDSGPVLVAVHYTVTPERQAAFFEAMGQLRRSRLRTGGTRWELYRDGERPNQFAEIFSRVCVKRGVECPRGRIERFIQRHYKQTGKQFRRCQPGDTISHALDLIHFERLPLELTDDVLDRAFESCFVHADSLDE